MKITRKYFTRALSYVVLGVFMLLSLCACTSKQQEANSPTQTTDQPELGKPLTDYSSFGFSNMFGMTEWVRIEDYEISDSNNATVTSGIQCYVLSFDNGYIEVRGFNSNYSGESNDHFMGNRTKGGLVDAYPYKLVSNYVLELQTTNKKSVEIVNFDLIAGVPIIEIKAGSPAYNINGTYIPTQFIDWSREPITEGNLSNITYYLRPDLIAD